MNIDFDSLKAVKAELDESTDLINKRLESFEVRLNELALGVSAWVQDGNDAQTKMGYIKFENNWCLVVQFKDQTDNENKIVPVLRSRRVLRLWCYKRLHLLIPALRECAIKLNEKMQKALEGEEETE